MNLLAKFFSTILILFFCFLSNSSSAQSTIAGSYKNYDGGTLKINARGASQYTKKGQFYRLSFNRAKVSKRYTTYYYSTTKQVKKYGLSRNRVSYQRSGTTTLRVYHSNYKKVTGSIARSQRIVAYKR